MTRLVAALAIAAGALAVVPVAASANPICDLEHCIAPGLCRRIECP